MSEKLLLLAVFVISMLLMGVNHRRKRKKIVFFGDLITSQGARTGGYIKYIVQLLKEADAEYQYELVGAGVDGNTVSDLLTRLDEDILYQGADVVVVSIGINDVLSKDAGQEASERDFAATYNGIIEKLSGAGIQAVLCTLTLIGEKQEWQNEHDPDLELYSEVVRNLAVQYELPLVDLRKTFLDHNRIYNPDNKEFGVLTFDGVHLNPRGNELVAREMWKVLQKVK